LFAILAYISVFQPEDGFAKKPKLVTATVKEDRLFTNNVVMME